MLKNIIKSALKLLGILLITIIISFTFLFLLELKKAEGNPTKATIGVLEKVADSVTEGEPIYVLFMGINEDMTPKLTDSIMLMGYNPNTQKAFIVSIPRDTFIGSNIKYAKAQDKINTLYSKGEKEIIEAVENITSVDINYYVSMNTEALIEVVDAIGGVEFDVPIDMKYNDKTQDLYINLKKGTQIIDGEKAEQLLRFRHNNDGSSYSQEYGDNDYGRMKTARNFVVETVKQCLATRDIEEISTLVKIAFDNVETNCSLSYILSYLVYAYNFNMEDLELEQIPGESVLSNGVWVFKYDRVQTQTLMNRILTNFNS